MSNIIKINYLKIEPSDYFKEYNDEDNYLINYKTKELNKINLNEDNKNNTYILKAIIDKYIDNCSLDEKDIDYFSLSYDISKYFCKSKNLNKETIEKNINYFFNRRVDILYSVSLVLNLEVMQNIGNILSYILYNIDYFKIKNKDDIKFKRNSLKKEELNVLTEFYNYVEENALDPNEENKSLFWYKKRDKSKLPSELLFLMNLFSNITNFNFDINFQDETFNVDHFKYLFLIMMNIDLFLINFDSININFIHEKLQNYIYSLFHKELLKSSNYDTLKINLIKDKDTLYMCKWNFKNNFMLNEFRNFELIRKKKYKEKNKFYEYEDFTLIEKNNKNSFDYSLLERANTFDEDFECFINNSNRINDYNIPSYNLSNKIIHKNKKHSLKLFHRKRTNSSNNNDIIENYHFSFEIIFTVLFFISIYDIKNIDFIINNSYNSEIIEYLQKFLKIDNNKINDNFHILDLCKKKLIEIESLNIEIDSFDLFTFERILFLILKNPKISSLKFSFFTSDINYFPYILYRTYFFTTNKKKINKNENISENKLLNFFFPYFKNNLLYVFYLIKKKNLKKIGINFDIPFILQKNENYMRVIMKFLINILIYLNDLNCRCNELTLLSPCTVFDGNIYKNIDKIFEEMNFYKENCYLSELNLQFIIYKIPNIKNIISINLVSLNLGELDLITLESITNYFHSFQFANYSLLRKINIKLLNTIEILSPKLKIILTSLFSIKLKNLIKFGLYTNIFIKNQKDCSFFIKILKNNWISSYTLIFNEDSQECFKAFVENSNIIFLVPHNLENELIGPDKINNKNISTNKDDIVYWYLKYLFNNRYSYISNNLNTQKNCIYNILKYLYFIKKIDISYKITNDNDKKK